jgi:hypothetical protein
MYLHATSYPRIFADESNREATLANLNGLGELAGGFAALTGWTLAYRETNASRVRREGVGCRNLPIQARLAIDDLATDAIQGAVKALPRERCDRLLTGINLILESLDEAREEIWRQNAELATGIPITDDGSAGEKLAILLNSLLTSAVDVVCGCRSALYLLDDGTQHLNLRTQVGFAPTNSPATTRELSRCKADLEALLGHAVVLEDQNRYANWSIPVECGAAVCLPVASANNLLGTLWVFDGKPREFTGMEINMLEIISGRIASELERFTLLQVARRATRPHGKFSPAADTFARPQLPSIQPPMEEVRVSGQVTATEQDGSAGAVFDWAICRRGGLAVLLAHAAGPADQAARLATVLQTAFRAHSAHVGSAQELFDSVFETAMSVGSGDSPVRFTCGYIDPIRGSCDLASTELQPGHLVVIDHEFEVQVCADSEASGEFGLAHVADLEMNAGDELHLTIGRPVAATDGGWDSSPDEPPVWDDDAIVAVTERKTTEPLVSLTIRRV